MTPGSRSQHRSIPPSVFLTLRRLAQPLFEYTVPRHLAAAGEPERHCHCRYPLFTLCTPEVSPYDAAGDYSAADLKIVDPPGGVPGPDRADAARPAPQPRVGTPLRPYNQRRWRGRSPALLWRPAVSAETERRRPCYRCEICEGFQQEQEDEREEPASLAGDPTTAVGGVAARGREGTAEEADVDGAVEEEEEVEPEPILRPTSTDIANTIMEDTEVANLRYLDPFLVEVSGRPAVGAQGRRFAMEVQQQLRRMRLPLKDTVALLPVATVVSAQHGTAYEAWVTQAMAAKRQAAKERGPRRRLEYLRQCAALWDFAAYSVRFAVAAYGLPYELGYFHTMRDITKLMAEPHRRYTAATSEEQQESMRRMLQGEAQEPLLEFALSRYSTEVGRPCCSVVLDHAARRVVVSFRGTVTMADMVVDVTEGYAEVDLLQGAAGLRGVQCGAASPASMQSVWQAPSSVRGRLERRLQELGLRLPASVHSEDATGSGLHLHTRIPLGFYEATLESAAVLLPALRTIHAQYSEYDLVLTGHSLGGIEATLFHLLFCLNRGKRMGSDPNNAAAAAAHKKKAPKGSEAGGQLQVPFARTFTITYGAAPVVEDRIVPQLNEVLAAEEARSGSRMLHVGFGQDFVCRLQVRSLRDLLCPTTNAAPASEAAAATPTATAADSGDTEASAGSSSSSSPLSHASKAAKKRPSKKQKEQQQKQQVAAAAAAATAAPPPPPIAPHSSAQHRKGHTAALLDTLLPTLALPGSVFHIPDSMKHTFFIVEENNRVVRRDLIGSVDAVFHHFPIFYLRAIHHLKRYYTHHWLEATRSAAAAAATGPGSGNHKGGHRPQDHHSTSKKS